MAQIAPAVTRQGALAEMADLALLLDQIAAARPALEAIPQAGSR